MSGMTVNEYIAMLQSMVKSGMVDGNRKCCIHTDFNTTILEPITDGFDTDDKVMFLGWGRGDNAFGRDTRRPATTRDNYYETHPMNKWYEESGN